MSDLELFQKNLPILKIQASLISLLWTDCFKECSIPSAPLLDTNYLPGHPPQPQCALTWFTASDDDDDGHTSDVQCFLLCSEIDEQPKEKLPKISTHPLVHWINGEKRAVQLTKDRVSSPILTSTFKKFKFLT